MKKTALLFLAALAVLFSAPIRAQTSTIPVHVVVDPGAAYVITGVKGTSVSAWVSAEIITRTNQIFTSSGMSVQLQLAGISNSATICCGANAAWGDASWIRGSIPIQSARDANTASMVIVVTNFDPTTEPYSTRSGCGSGGGSPENAVAGFSISAQSGGRDIAALAIGNALCMNPLGYTYRRGTSPGDCEAAVTVESTNIPYNYGIQFNNVVATCWQTSSGGQCFSSGHDAIVGIATAAGWQNCTYTNGSGTGTQWDETMSCPYVGYATFHANYGTTTTSFVCNNVTRLGRYSNPNSYYKGVPMGDSAYNNAGLISTQANAAKMYWQTRLAPKLKAAAAVAIDAAKN